jgi:hypothetical protein
VHPQLQRALDVVLRDLRATGAPLPRVTDEDWSDEPGTVTAMLWSEDGSGAGVFVLVDEPAADSLARVAEAVHDWVLEEVQGTNATNWPPCPRHPGTHPLVVAAGTDGQPTWTCPRDAVPVCRIGELG